MRTLIATILIFGACGDDDPATERDTAPDAAPDVAVETASETSDAIDDTPDTRDAVDTTADTTPLEVALISLAPGALDPGYGEDGLVTTPWRWNPYGIIELSDGGVLIYGANESAPVVSGHVGRLTMTGAPNSAFGIDGVATLPPRAFPYAALLAPDGRIVLTGVVAGPNTAGVWRLHGDGTIDTTFGVDGTALGDLPGDGGALTVDAAGTIRVLVRGADRSLMIVQLRPDGTRDPAFGEDGVTTAQIATLGLNATWPTSDGGFLQLASRATGGGYVKVTAAGEIDLTFGVDGYLATRAFESVRDASGRYLAAFVQDTATAPLEVPVTVVPGATIGLLPKRADGGAVVVHGRSDPVRAYPYVQAITPDGEADTSFGTDGTFDPDRDLGLPVEGFGVLGTDATGNLVFASAGATGPIYVVRLGL